MSHASLPVTSPDDVRAIHAELLAPSFPPAELVGAESLVGAWERGAVRITALAHDDGRTLAVAIGSHDAESGVVLLEYLAARPGVRGSGAGAAVLQRALDEWQEAWHPQLVVGEVEHPASVPADADHGDPAARVRFYHRAGARALDVPYFQPPIASGQPRVPLMLLAFRVDGALPGDDVPAAPLRAWLEGQVADEPQDNQVTALLAAAAGDRVAAIPLTAPPEQLPSPPGGPHQLA